MFIAYLEPPCLPGQGDTFYRTVQPCTALAARAPTAAAPDVDYVASGSWLSPWMHQAAWQADVLVLCQAFDTDFLPLLHARRRRGLRTVVEINDNFCAPQAFNPVAAFYQQAHIRSLIYQLARLADGLQLCSTGLKSRFAHLNRHTLVLPNQLPEPLQLVQRRSSPAAHQARRSSGIAYQARRRVTVGWAGSLGHRDDIKAVLPVLQQLLQRCPQVQLAFMASAALHGLFAALPPARLQLHPGGDLASYNKFLESIDIGLAPLLPNEFNACRSDVKYLELSRAGAVVVASRQPAYTATIQHGHNGFLFDDPHELLSLLTMLVVSPQRRQAVVQCAQQNLQQTRRISLQTVAHRQFYAQLPLRCAARTTPHRSPEARFAAVLATCQASSAAYAQPHARYLHSAFGAYERLLYTGLQATADAAPLARQQLRQACADKRDFYVAPLCLSHVTAAPQQAIALLEEVLRLQPQSLKACLNLGHHWRQQGQLQKAQYYLQQGLRLAADHAPTHEALALTYLEQQQTQRAALHLGLALQANRDYHPPAARLALLHKTQPQHPARLPSSP